MRNAFNEKVSMNDVEFVCFIIEKISRKIKQSNQYVVKHLAKNGVEYLLDYATMLHSQNFDQTSNELIEKYQLSYGNNEKGDYPSELYMGTLYSNLIWEIDPENIIQSLFGVYNNPICKTIDNYETSAHYEPLPTIVRAYYDGTF